MTPEWLPVGIKWEAMLEWVPEAFCSTLIGTIGYFVFQWMINMKWCPNFIPISILPVAIAYFTFTTYMSQTDGSRVPQWSVDPGYVRGLIAAAVAAVATAPVFFGIAKHAKNTKKEETTFWTDKPKNRKPGGHKQCDE